MKVIPRERLEFTEKLYREAVDDGEIQRRVAAQFGCTKRAVRRYLQRVRAKLAAEFKATDPDAARVQILSLLKHAYDVAELGGTETGPNAGAMVNAATRMAEVQGLLTKKIEHSGAIGTPNYDDLQRRLAKLAAGDGARADAPPVGELEPGGPEDPR